MSQSLFWNLLAKKLSGEADAGELEQLEKLTKDNPDLIYAASLVSDLWPAEGTMSEPYDSELAFEVHLEKLKNNGIFLPELQTPLTDNELTTTGKKPRRRLVMWGTAAGVAALVLILAFRFWPANQSEPTLMMGKNVSEVSTRFGSKSKLVLPDSTVVWLNAGSRLTYDEGFGREHRNTTLAGEAFFDVTKDNVPFIINTKNVQIKVLGTAFNVKAYPNEKTVETSLLRGRVEIRLASRPDEPYILMPNEKLAVTNEAPDAPSNTESKLTIVRSGLTLTPSDSTIVETCWVDNKLIFQDESFSDIARKMERWYDVSIRIRDERLSEMRLTGTFESENIRQALTALQIAFPFQFTMTGNQIQITP